ncbi:MAG TPA: CVNH domain-containing protein [Candidatus Sulfotelmatobacter sp.]|nr:CVNH domain-containing protein [Candidatus Sulfotelmatobacter sp.]
MKSILTGALAALTLIAASFGPAVAQPYPPGSYQASCTGIHVRNGLLVAHCTAANGAVVRSTIPLGRCGGGPVANNNGRLVCGGGAVGYVPPGSYQQSCQNAHMENGLLVAMCNRAGGGLRRSQIDPRRCRGANIVNSNGRLVCG